MTSWRPQHGRELLVLSDQAGGRTDQAFITSSRRTARAPRSQWGLKSIVGWSAHLHRVVWRPIFSRIGPEEGPIASRFWPSLERGEQCQLRA
jgi:hypothetical protein